jgi:hypothetical protein
MPSTRRTGEAQDEPTCRPPGRGFELNDKYEPDPKARDVRLTFYQRHALLVLAQRGPSACNEWDAWYPMTTGQAYGVIDRLYRRGLVEPAGFSSYGKLARTFAITERGIEALGDEVAPEEEP